MSFQSFTLFGSLGSHSFHIFGIVLLPWFFVEEECV
jgi:hypothetical protein